MKPPYRVPLMTEINAQSWNGYNAVSTFSGCGGSSLGYKMAGFKVLWANEFTPSAQDTYRANYPQTVLDTRDIRQVTGADILSAINLDVGQLDLFDGSPPCASFSNAGKRESGWGKVNQYFNQRTDDLFFEYARLIRDVQPKVFVAENVSGLIKGTAKGYFKLILQELKSCGYKVEARLLDAQWLGVPQRRQRLIFIGVRNDLPAVPVFPEPLPYRYSVREVLPSIVAYEEANGHNSKGLCAHRMIPVVDQSFPTVQAGRPVYVIAREDDRQIERRMTIDELRTIGGFPDDFILTGIYARQWERIGRAVPPVMMSHIAATIRDKVLLLCQ